MKKLIICFALPILISSCTSSNTYVQPPVDGGYNPPSSNLVKVTGRANMLRVHQCALSKNLDPQTRSNIQAFIQVINGMPENSSISVDPTNPSYSGCV